MRLTFFQTLATATLLVCGRQILNAQLTLGNAPQMPTTQRVAVPFDKVNMMGAEGVEALQMPAGEGNLPAMLSFSDAGSSSVIGYTHYDLQSNAAIDDRFVQGDFGSRAAWTMSWDSSPFGDRGTGYNERSGADWGEIPFERIESVRTGWPSLVQLGSGQEVVFSHASIADPIHMARRDLATGSWVESWLPNGAVLPSGSTVGNLWPRAAVGGASQQHLHVICVTTPLANGGQLFQGQDGALLYYRSLDAGNTWEAMTFPALDSTHFSSIGADAYAIHAEGNKVAFAVFNELSDSFVMVSTDAGSTWEYTVLSDFPVDLYILDTGLPSDQGVDYNGDGLAQEYLNSDGAGDIHVDVDGKVHCVFGAMFYADDDLSDGNYTYYPGTNGLQYWREDFGPDSSVTIAYAFDMDGSGTLDLESDLAAYFVGLASLPSMGSDAAGNLYVSYSAVMENFSSGIQNYRHVYLVRSEDNGASWNTDGACDLTPDIDYDGLENVFASLPPRIGDTLEVVFQRDFEPGLHVRGDEDPLDLNALISLKLPVASLGTCAIWPGCTEPGACNYDPSATLDDGSCNYWCYDCTAPVSPSSLSHPFISEYVEGWGNNKALEIFNPTDQLLDMADYRLERYVNGAFASEANQMIALEGMLSPLDVFVYTLDKQDPDGVDFEAPVWDELAAVTDFWLCPVYEENNAMYYNGNDALVLRHTPSNTVVDVFGKVGQDPGTTGWAGMTQNHTLIRKQVVYEGDTNPIDPFLVVDEWDGIAWVDDSTNSTLDIVFANLGWHAYCLEVVDEGCTDPEACNYMPTASTDDGTCDYSCFGCTDDSALNWNPGATVDDGSCQYVTTSCDFIGDAFWGELEAGLYSDTLLWHYAGTSAEGSWVLSMPALITEPASGTNYAVSAWFDLEISNLPSGLTASGLPASMAGGEQACVSYEGIPVTPGVYPILVSGQMEVMFFGNPYLIGVYNVVGSMEILPNPNPIPGCTYPVAVNYVDYATVDDGTCLYAGCTDPGASNYHPVFILDDGSCIYCSGAPSCPSDVDEDGAVGTSDLLLMLSNFGLPCD